MDSQVLGKSYTKLSDQVQQAKLQLWQRSTYSQNPRRRFIINSMTARVLRQAGCIPAS